MNHPESQIPAQTHYSRQPPQWHEVDFKCPIEFTITHKADPAIIELFHDFLNMLEPVMSQLSDAIANVNKSADDALARVKADVDALNAKVADLQSKVDQGTASQADFDALKALQGKLDALDPTNPATVPTDGGTVTPPAPTDGGTNPVPTPTDGSTAPGGAPAPAPAPGGEGQPVPSTVAP